MIAKLVKMVAISMIKKRRNAFLVVIRMNSLANSKINAQNALLLINFMIMIRENAFNALRRTNSLMRMIMNARNVLILTKFMII